MSEQFMIDDYVKVVATKGGRERWDVPTDGYLDDIHIKRIEQINDHSWEAYYDEPDTGTEESMLVEQKADRLEASYNSIVYARLELPV